jgi:hypothetical protein
MKNQHTGRDYTYPEVIILFGIGAIVVGLAHAVLVRMVGQEWAGGLSVGLLMLVSTTGFRVLDRRHGRPPGITWAYVFLISALGVLATVFFGPLAAKFVLGN